MKKYKEIFTLFVIVLIIIGMYAMSGLIGVLQIILVMSFYCVVAYLLSCIWRVLRKKEIQKGEIFIKYFFYRLSIFICITGFFVGSFLYYQNHISPAIMPEVTLSNGEKIIKFQTMSHIASEDFYDQITKNISKAKHNGFVYFFEGVQRGTKESQKKFNEALGIQFDENLYKNFAKLYGVVSQDNRKFLGIKNNKDYNVDISIDTIIKLYEKYIGEKKQGNLLLKKSPPLNLNKEILTALDSLNDRQLALLRYVNKAILNMILKSETIQKGISQKFPNKALFEIILHQRDKNLANAIINTQEKKIYITYGLMHLQGVEKLLKQHDPNWKVIKTRALFPIQ